MLSTARFTYLSTYLFIYLQCPGSAKVTIYPTTRDSETAKGVMRALNDLTDAPADTVIGILSTPEVCMYVCMYVCILSGCIRIYVIGS